MAATALVNVSRRQKLPSAAGMDLDAARRLVDTFLNGRAAATLRTYRQGLADFATFTRAETAEDAVRNLLPCTAGQANALALDYRNALVNAGKAAATVNNRLAALRSVVELVRLTGLVSWTIEVQGLKAETYRDTRGVGRTGYRRLLEELDRRTDAKGRRDRAILHLLYDLALRRIEVTRLDLEDFDPQAATLAVMGKGRTGKEPLSLPTSTIAALEAWVVLRGSASGPLFLNLDRAGQGDHNGRRLSTTSINRLVTRLGKAAEMTARPHGLRHAAITEALDLSHGNLRAVARFSRHRSVRTLMRYDDNREDLGGAIAKLVADAAALKT
jgi:integrase/recombinase XerC